MGHGCAITQVLGLALLCHALGYSWSFAAPTPSTTSCTRQGQCGQQGGPAAPQEPAAKERASSDALVGAAEVVVGISLLLSSIGAPQARARRRSPTGSQTSRLSAAEGAVPAPFDVLAQPGICAPYGEPGTSCWDPAGLAEGLDEATFRKYRQAELKHGRVCMMAVLGLVAQVSGRFNLAYPYDAPDYDFSAVPSGLQALGVTTVASGWLGVLAIAAGLIELSASDDERAPGDFGDPFGFARSWGLTAGLDDTTQWKNFELNHGRLAMVGFLGAASAECATGLDAAGQWERSGAAFQRTLALLTFSREPVPPLQSFF